MMDFENEFENEVGMNIPELRQVWFHKKNIGVSL
jgi:hypothetical protein